MKSCITMSVHTSIRTGVRYDIRMCNAIELMVLFIQLLTANSHTQEQLLSRRDLAPIISLCDELSC